MLGARQSYKPRKPRDSAAEATEHCSRSLVWSRASFAMLCQKCSSITFSLQTGGYGDSNDYLEYRHYETYALLCSSARSCHLCRQVAYETTKPLHPPYGVAVEEKMLAAGPVYIRGTIEKGPRKRRLRPSSLYFICEEVIKLNFVIVDEDLYGNRAYSNFKLLESLTLS